LQREGSTRAPGNHRAMAVEIKRTLVKSRPELWAEVSDEGTLARHLNPLDSVRITRAEAETVVDWEGERVRGSVRLEPSGFGTRVTLTAAPREEEPAPPPPAPAPAPAPFWARLLRRQAPSHFSDGARHSPEVATSSRSVRSVDEDARIEALLTEVMDALGAAHHRPFSRV
jgi:hypothetical protein